MPTLFSVRGWSEELDPTYVAFVEEMRSTGTAVIDVFPDADLYSDFGEWAHGAVVEILDQHEEGQPLHLLGYCGGGSLLQVAVGELESRGVRPAYVGYIDVRAGNPRQRLRQGLDSIYRVAWRKRVRFQLVRLTPPDRESLRSVLHSVVTRAIASTLEIRQRGWRSSKRVIPSIQQPASLAANWEFGSVTTPSYLYNCQHTIDTYWPGNPSLGRAPVLRGGFAIRVIEGSHQTCIAPPHSAALIERIESDRSRASPAVTI
jgi:thioesterase domain-containing protein